MHVERHCNPFKDSLPYSCLGKNLLVDIAKGITKAKKIDIDTTCNVKVLYNNICKIMKNEFKCNTEACWLSIRDLMNNLSKKSVNLMKDHFRTMMPPDIVKSYTNWLSNFDIDKVLEQYDTELDDFYYYGAVPIDFKKCSVSNLCRFNLGNHLNHGETKIGIVFNTDESDEPGSHWISMYMDLMGKNLKGQPGIYYFDSYGGKPPQEVKDLIENVSNQGKKHKKEFIVSINEKSHQKNNYACGFYCMHFLENMIKDVNFKKYNRDRLSDKRMRGYINHCFLHPNEIKPGVATG